jgi:4-amino-4-deoxy-L-arabinose transferase-like glycosyltransferase
MSTVRFRAWAGAILLVAFMLRLAAGVWWQERLAPGQQFGFGDSAGYWELARTMAAGEPYQYGSSDARIFRTPGYPFLLSLLFRLYQGEPPVLAARALSALLGTIAVGLVMRLGRQLFSAPVGLLAGGWAAIYPEAIAMSTFVLSEAPFCVFMLLHLLAWISAWQTDCPRHRSFQAFIGGVWGGVATLMRPSWLLFLPFAGVIALAVMSRRPKQATLLAIMLAGLCLTMLPWWVRNYGVAGRFVPTSLQVGASLYDGLSPTATGASDMSFVPRFVAAQRAADAGATQPPPGIFEDRLDRRLRDASLAWARQHPGAALKLAGVKFWRMWNFLPNAAEMRGATLRLALALTYSPTIVLALIGAWRFAQRDWPYVLCLLPAVYFTLLHCIFVSSIRYRQPAMLPLIILAAAVTWEWWSGHRARRPVGINPVI